MTQFDSAFLLRLHQNGKMEVATPHLFRNGEKLRFVSMPPCDLPIDEIHVHSHFVALLHLVLRYILLHFSNPHYVITVISECVEKGRIVAVDLLLLERLSLADAKEGVTFGKDPKFEGDSLLPKGQLAKEVIVAAISFIDFVDDFDSIGGSFSADQIIRCILPEDISLILTFQLFFMLPLLLKLPDQFLHLFRVDRPLL